MACLAGAERLEQLQRLEPGSRNYRNEAALPAQDVDV
jgi:hypothetical protein